MRDSTSPPHQTEPTSGFVADWSGPALSLSLSLSNLLIISGNHELWKLSGIHKLYTR